MNPKLQRAYNDQIQLEFASAYAYAQMSAWCSARDLRGFAAWFRAQWAEENTHALKFTDFLLNRGAEVQLQAIEAPGAGYTTPLEVAEHALGHERRVTASIGALYQLSSDLHDYASLPLLQWFLNEQVEEEASVSEMVADLRRAGDDSSALFLLDRELASRRETSGS